MPGGHEIHPRARGQAHPLPGNRERAPCASMPRLLATVRATHTPGDPSPWPWDAWHTLPKESGGNQGLPHAELVWMVNSGLDGKQPQKKEAWSPGDGEAWSPRAGEAGSPRAGEAGSPRGGEAGSPRAGEAGSPGGGEAGSPGGGEAGSPGLVRQSRGQRKCKGVPAPRAAQASGAQGTPLHQPPQDALTQ